MGEASLYGNLCQQVYYCLNYFYFILFNIYLLNPCGCDSIFNFYDKYFSIQPCMFKVISFMFTLDIFIFIKNKFCNFFNTSFMVYCLAFIDFIQDFSEIMVVDDSLCIFSILKIYNMTSHYVSTSYLIET